MAVLHARCFAGAPRPWAADEFSALLAARGSFLLSRPEGFLLGRTVADEAELLTLAVAPEARRQGLGRDLTARFATAAAGRGAGTAFLEVAADNRPARALYAGLGWTEAGRRPGYYGAGRDALVLRLAL
ncbi:GNAT family N-acetyltransferase [Paracoccus marinaquae]|uniref:GNAT family N-acetyltransferase n=1 Tax=Paracoccus marinaquae TaxID=2841926 RepID=A0ABS6ADB1_9RHOB|nr:GNAT family N-acetyltransferase [Paracoccus marinaquae]MBU3028583.1 GNAT family N-acetyltransferase [Paracoccus marinaquae]